MILFTSESGTHQSWLHPQVRIGDEVAKLNRTPKIVAFILDTHFTFGPHVRDCYQASLEVPNVMKTLAGVHNRNFGVHLQGHRASHPELHRPHLVHSSVFYPPRQTFRWFRTRLWGSRPACHLQTAVSHLRAETGGPPFEGAPRTVFTAVLC